MNWLIILTMIGLLVFSVFSVYAAGEFRPGDDISTAWRKQMIYAIFGFVIFLVTSLIDYRWIRWGAPFAYLGGLVGLALLSVDSLAIELYGQKSWIRIGGFSLQPSQPAIIGGILLLAVALTELPKKFKIFRFHFLRLAVTGILAGIPMAMILKDDLGSGMVWAPVLASMWLLGKVPYRYLISITLVGLMVAPLGYFFALKPHQQSRIDTLVRMASGKEVNLRDEGWDINHITIAIGSGGWDGKGYLAKNIPEQRSINRMRFIPDTAINDYIFAVIAEEHGFRGSMLMIVGLAFLLVLCITVAFFSRDQLGRLVAVGAVAMLFFHIFWNIGMCLMLLPIVGIPLPLISYGGTFLLSVMFLLGLVQSVWVHRNTPVTTKESSQSTAKGSAPTRGNARNLTRRGTARA